MSLVPAKVTWSSTGTTSDGCPIGGALLCGLIVPAGFTGTSVTFSVSIDQPGTVSPTYFTLYDAAGVAVSVTLAASRHVVLTPSSYSGINFLKLVSSASEASGREVRLAIRPAA